MAVPLVQIHATACYVDLPANAAAAALVLLVLRLYTTPEPAAAARPALPILALAALVANMRFQLHPVVALALLAAAPRLLPPLVRGRDWRALGVLVLAVPLVGATFLKNAVVHHNPYYPMRLALGGVVLPGPDTPYSSSPVYLEHAPQAWRFLCSILEIGIRPLGDERRWTVDQWAPWDSPALRMGGFFGAYVVFHLGAPGVDGGAGSGEAGAGGGGGVRAVHRGDGEPAAVARAAVLPVLDDGAGGAESVVAVRAGGGGAVAGAGAGGGVQRVPRGGAGGDEVWIRVCVGVDVRARWCATRWMRG